MKPAFHALILAAILAAFMNPLARAQGDDAHQWVQVEQQIRSALQNASNPVDARRLWSELGQVLERQRRYEEAIEAYRNAGDTMAMGRAEENLRTMRENARIEAENRHIREMEAERRRLEEELRELGGPPPR
ncbi:tetratricopeptide repeat protein [Wenzhouxiangella marina]|uniref:Uncharacterized protein n=1 Tax=Wenzhouxiangella marina TaxID=1579979 RepID=A0A0K0XYG6_9GAMM|nr:tetratricopeptide repeat protein [Wenzhouxiangella marina]AKS42705.1 hypothetical protein WM2015_2342 [Wenzhouxiangella marina]MBB6088606.1 tetratricopeptide (TPR) repeat protein [Wenzhouxiangella marina]